MHHWDENGLFPNETTDALPPPRIKDVQCEEVEFVKLWVLEYQIQKQGLKWWSKWGKQWSWGWE